LELGKQEAWRERQSFSFAVHDFVFDFIVSGTLGRSGAMSLVVEHRLAHAACSLGCGIVSVYLTWSVM
jgi:hypothetical protein